jgi:hypothetical protein
MKRWLVIFTSEALNDLSDATYVSVHAATTLEAIVRARREQPIPHPWSTAKAIPWPRGARTVEGAMRRASASSS